LLTYTSLGHRCRSRPMQGVACVLGVVACLGSLGIPGRAAGAAPPGAPVTSVSGDLVLPAQVAAYQAALLTAKVAGYLRSIPVDKGDKVKGGELIAELEVPELLADRLQYRAQVDVAHRNFERMQQASRSAPDLVTPESLDNAHGELEVAQARLDRIETLLRYARITAPFSGTITARYVDPGAFIPVPGASSQQSAAIVTLMDFSRVRIQIPIPETDAPRIRPGRRTDAAPAELYTSTVTRIRLWLVRFVPLLGRWVDVAPACCGVCPTCIGAAATGVTATWIGSLSRRDD